MNNNSAAISEGTTAVRTGFAIDADTLDAWLTKNVSGYLGELRIAQFAGGQSNPTYKLETSGRNYVLRRKPPGPLLKGAHAIEREARVLQCLEKTGFPVPHVHAVCEDPNIVGTPFYIMEMVEGRIFWDAAIPEVAADERAAIFDAMNTTIAALHRIDYKAAGLDDFGRPGNYFERQISRWSSQYLSDDAAGRDPNMDRLVEWLPSHIPVGDETAIVHGDFRIDNMIFHSSEPRILAVLDWELATLGHPGADFAYHAMMYRMPPHIVAGLGGSDIAALNIPDEQEYLDAYCRRTRRESMPDYNFYVAFNLFRLAAIFHGIRGRVLRGTASSAQARQRSAYFPELAELAWRQAAKVE